MALKLKISALEQNDNKGLVLYDITGSYSVDNTTGWGGINTNVSSIDGTSTKTLSVTITVTTPTETTVYNSINLYTTFKQTDYWSTPSELVFNITPNILINSNGVPMGAADTLLPDGIYKIQYQLDGVPEAQTQLIVFISGQVRTTTYSLFLDLIDTIEVEDLVLSDRADKAMYAYTMLRGLENCAYIARQTTLIKGLSTLNKYCLNVNNAWK